MNTPETYKDPDELFDFNARTADGTTFLDVLKASCTADMAEAYDKVYHTSFCDDYKAGRKWNSADMKRFTYWVWNYVFQPLVDVQRRRGAK